MLIPRLAWRNLGRNPRRTGLTMSAMGLATGLLVLVLGYVDGFFADMIRVVTELERGHVVVAAPEYLERNRLENTLPASGPDAAPTRLKPTGRIEAIAGRLRGWALLSAGDDERMQTVPVELLGIDPQMEAGVTALIASIRQGAPMVSMESDGIVLGAGLARRLRVEVGDEVAAMGQGADGSIAQALWTVTGIFETGDAARDGGLALLGRETLGEFLVLEDAVHEWVIRLADPLGAMPFAAAVSTSVPGAEVIPWQGVMPQIAAMLDMAEVSQWFSAIFFYFAVVLIAVNTMSMSFFERTREFAVMGAVGLSPKRMWRLLLLEGVFMSTVAALIGAALGWAGSSWLAANPILLGGPGLSFAGATIEARIATLPTLGNVTRPMLVMIVVGLLAALPPAIRLRRLRPVDSLREV